MLKVTLVNPPQFSGYPQPPMGLLQLAAVLESEGYTVRIVDANALGLLPEEIVPHLNDTDIVGLTAMTPTVMMAVDIARESKKAGPGIPVVLGGNHATLLPEETLEAAPEIDYLVRGEGEETFIELLAALETGGAPDEIRGISYRKDGRIVNTESGQGIQELDSLPFLAYHLISLNAYKPHAPHGRASPFAVMITSRGCPYQCAYCSKPVFGSRFRVQSPERVVDEIDFLQESFGVRELAFYDDVFTLDKERADGIAEEIRRRGLKILWSCETRVNLVDKELLRNMKRAGCYSVSYGIESGSQAVLKTIDKGINLDQVEEAVRYTREAGMQVTGYFMLGSPGETPETIRETIDFARKLKLDFAQFSITTPFPGTALFDIYLKSGGEGDIPWDSYVYAGSGKGNSPVFESPSLSREDILYWQKRAYQEFYLRISYLYRRLLRSISMGDIKVNLRGVSMLMKSIRQAGNKQP